MTTYRWNLGNVAADVHMMLQRHVSVLSGSAASEFIVGTGSTNHAHMDAFAAVPSSAFTSTTPPDAVPDTTTGDCLRTQYPYTGDFASGTWTITAQVRPGTASATNDGRYRWRVLKGSNGSGSGATEITSSQVQGALCTDIASTQAGGATFSLPAFSLANEYLFVQWAFERTGAGGMSSTSITLGWGGGSVDSGGNTSLLSTDWTPTSFGGYIGNASFGGTPGGTTAMDAALTANVAVGDLIVVATSELNANSSVGCSDSLGNTYTALAGATSGTANLAGFYSVVTNAGSATITVDTTPSANSFAMVATAYKGPFESSPLDVNSVVMDAATPLTANATGTLAQADELIVGYFGGLTSNFYTATPSTGAEFNVMRQAGGSPCVTLTSMVVSATTTQTLSVAGSSVTTLCGVATFKQKSLRKIDITAGSFTFAGAAVTPKRARKVFPDTGTFAFAGAAVTLHRGRPLVVTPGSFAFAGQDVVLKRERKVIITPASFAFTGANVDLERGRKIIIDPASFVFTGQDVTLTKAVAARKVIVDPGAFAFSGLPVTLRRGRKVVIDPGAFVFTGQSVTLAKGRKISIDPGAFVFAGQDVAFRRTYRISITAGSFTFAGQQVALKRAQKIAITAGSFVFAGQDVSLRKTYKLTITAGSFVFAGQDVALKRGRRISIDPGAFVFAGQPVTLKHGYRVAITQASFVFTGQAVALKRGRAVTIDLGSFIFAGQEVNFKRNRRIIVDPGTFVFTGSNVGLIKAAEKILTVEIGAFIFAGQQVSLKRAMKVVVTAGSFVFTGQDVALKRGRKILIDPGAFVFAGTDVTLTKSGVASNPRRGDFFTVMPY